MNETISGSVCHAYDSGQAAGTYRTRGRAGEVFPVARIAATITHPDYEKALTTTPGKSAFLQPTSSNEIRVQSGMLYMDGHKRPPDATQLTEYFIRDVEGKLSEQDLPALNVIFSTMKNAIDEQPDLFLEQRKKAIYSMGALRLYVPELMDALGANAANLGKARIFNQGGRIKKKRQIIRKEKAKIPRDIEFVCLKNRYGTSSYVLNFEYNPAYDIFTEPNLAFYLTRSTKDEDEDEDEE